MKPETIEAFNESQSADDRQICEILRRAINRKRWLGKARTIQWDYRNIQQRKGKLLRIR